MKFGFVLPNYGRQATRYSIIDSALEAEKNGFDSIWLTDHLALPESDGQLFGHIFESITTMSYLAASTRTIKLGLSTLVLPQRNPVEIAKSLATIDNLSNGRLVVSVGIGWSEGEYKNLGYDFKNRGKRMDEAVKVLRTCWRGQGTIDFKGEYYNFGNMVFSPPPVQSGGPPLWIAGDSSKALSRAVSLGDGWHPNAHSAEHLTNSLKKVKSFIQLRPFTIAVRVGIDLEPDRQPSNQSMISGSPENIICQLHEYEKAGMNYAIVNLRADSQAKRESAIRQFMSEIAPAMRD
ncbi:MAG TPA: TIGR03619 family F420-dependent LLM class oxidoreductase [Anaerolineaceae bacterium]|nr:TIGR03619 family F420-dependent LLM class oxidoreductase [Anaerolineaceae bacterium]